VGKWWVGLWGEKKGLTAGRIDPMSRTKAMFHTWNMVIESMTKGIRDVEDTIQTSLALTVPPVETVSVPATAGVSPEKARRIEGRIKQEAEAYCVRVAGLKSNLPQDWVAQIRAAGVTVPKYSTGGGAGAPALDVDGVVRRVAIENYKAWRAINKVVVENSFDCDYNIEWNRDVLGHGRATCL
jgi:hypothetical protein